MKCDRCKTLCADTDEKCFGCGRALAPMRRAEARAEEARHPALPLLGAVAAIGCGALELTAGSIANLTFATGLCICYSLASRRNSSLWLRIVACTAVTAVCTLVIIRQFMVTDPSKWFLNLGVPR